MKAKMKNMKTYHIHSDEICPTIVVKKLFTIFKHLIGGAATAPENLRLERVSQKSGHVLCKQIIERCQHTEFFSHIFMIHLCFDDI
jgi:hypothetical protein